MILFEGYKKAVEIYNRHTETDNGRKMVTWYNNELGVSAKYLVWFTKCIVCYNIPLYIVLDTYKDWKRYVVPYYKGNSQQLPDMGNLNYQQAVKIINECKRHWAKPNPIYEQNGIYVGEFKTFRDANMLPINTTWCITKTRQRFHDFNNEKSKCLYIINNHNQDPWRRVIAVIYDDRIDYWDSRNKRMDDIDQSDYEKTLPRDVIDIIHNVSLSNNNKNNDIKTEHMMRNKRTYRLTESRLRGMIHEVVKSVLNEEEDFLVTPIADEVLNYSGLDNVITHLYNIEGSDVYSMFAYQLAKALEQFVNHWRYGDPANDIEKWHSREDVINMRRNRVKSNYPDKNDDEIDAINRNHFYCPLKAR